MPGERHLHPTRRRTWWIWITYWALLFVVMHVPISRDIHVPIRHGDKLLHVLAYFLLTWLGGRHRMTIGRDGQIAAVLAWGVVYVGYAALDEWLQAFVGRTTSLGDWYGNIVGVGLATLALLIWCGRANYRNHSPRTDRM